MWVCCAWVYSHNVCVYVWVSVYVWVFLYSPSVYTVAAIMKGSHGLVHVDLNRVQTNIVMIHMLKGFEARFFLNRLEEVSDTPVLWQTIK